MAFFLSSWPPRLVSLTVPVTSEEQSTSYQSLLTPETELGLSGERTVNGEAGQGNETSRWRTTEFRLYEIVTLIGVISMVYTGVTLSSATTPNFHLYSHKLSQGWISGRLMDVTDPQYSLFRKNLPFILILVTIFLSLHALFKKFEKEINLQQKPLLGLCLVSLSILHGFSIIKILIICGLNYLLIKKIPHQSDDRIISKALPAVLIWFFNLAVLVVNEVTDGWTTGFMDLDIFLGFIPRWHITFNICVLRLISFGMDYHWAHTASRGSTVLVSELPTSDKERCSTSHQLSTYSFENYLCYILYTPLYVAGPIMSFNNFQWQQSNPKSIPLSYKLTYAFRFCCSLFCMEVLLQFIYVVAIKDTEAWAGFTPGQLSMVGFWNLIVVWLKLLLPWRFFRLWALLDGIDPPENMIRCMANNYSTFGFWKSWHRSYNLWLVRYVYIPLGGSKRPVLSTAVVFTFVALWHDLTLTLLTWGWLIILIMIPEIIATRFLPTSKFGNQWWFRHVCALGGVSNILTMTSANLVGFAIGTKGMIYMLDQIWSSWSSIAGLLGSCAGLFCGVQIMMEYRETEKRAGIHRKC